VPQEVSVFDRVAFVNRLMGDEDLARTVMEGFLEDMPRQIRALAGVLAGGEAQGATRQAHTIKGAAANVSAEALCRTAAEIEAFGHKGNLPAMKGLLAPLEVQFAELRNAMLTSPLRGPTSSEAE
jgi:HPt (histidine-containing phosphotransfer) domain-containing protein